MIGKSSGSLVLMLPFGSPSTNDTFAVLSLVFGEWTPSTLVDQVLTLSTLMIFGCWAQIHALFFRTPCESFRDSSSSLEPESLRLHRISWLVELGLDGSVASAPLPDAELAPLFDANLMPSSFWMLDIRRQMFVFFWRIPWTELFEFESSLLELDASTFGWYWNLAYWIDSGPVIADFLGTESSVMSMMSSSSSSSSFSILGAFFGWDWRCRFRECVPPFSAEWVDKRKSHSNLLRSSISGPLFRLSSMMSQPENQSFNQSFIHCILPTSIHSNQHICPPAYKMSHHEYNDKVSQLTYTTG